MLHNSSHRESLDLNTLLQSPHMLVSVICTLHVPSRCFLWGNTLSDINSCIEHVHKCLFLQLHCHGNHRFMEIIFRKQDVSMFSFFLLCRHLCWPMTEWLNRRRNQSLWSLLKAHVRPSHSGEVRLSRLYI